MNIPELRKNLRSLASWFRLMSPSYLTPEAKQKSALVCEDAANELESPRFTADEIRMFASHGEVDLWYVNTDRGTYYPVKIVAEQAARILHPGDDPNSHVCYHRFMRVD